MARSPKLSYRVSQIGSHWLWEVLEACRNVLESGTASTSEKARAKAMLTAMSIFDMQRDVANDPTGFMHHDKVPTMH